jgi:hypothetical protein
MNREKEKYHKLVKKIPAMYVKDKLEKQDSGITQTQIVEGVTRYDFKIGGRVYFYYVNDTTDQLISDEVKFTKVVNLKRFTFGGNGKVQEEEEEDFTAMVRPKSTTVIMFKVDGKHNGVCVYKFESKWNASKEMTDQDLVIHIKANTSDIS